MNAPIRRFSPVLPPRTQQPIRLQPPGLTPAKPRIDLDAFDRTMDAQTKSRRTIGNKQEWLFEGDDAAKKWIEMIDRAQSTIHIEYYAFANDEVGKFITNRLIEKAKKGVKIRLIVDGFGSDSAGPVLDQLRRAGAEIDAQRPQGSEPSIDVRVYNPPSMLKFWRYNRRLHSKALIIDGREAVVGGRGMTKKYTGSGEAFGINYPSEQRWSDTDTHFSGPAVHDVQKQFFAVFNSSGKKVSEAEQRKSMPLLRAFHDGVTIRVVEHRPEEDKSDIETLFLTAIRASKRSITLEIAYFVPTKAIVAALKQKAREGVYVRLLVSSKEHMDTPLVAVAGRHYFKELMDAGVDIYEARYMMHAKTACFDGVLTICGSANLDNRSFHLNTELDTVTESEELARQYELDFEKDIVNADKMTYARLDSFSWWDDFLGFLFALPFVRYFF